MVCCLLKLLSIHLLGHFPKCSDVFDTWNFSSCRLLWRASVTIQLILLMFLLSETSSLPMIFSSFPFELSTPLAPLWILSSTELLHPWGLKGQHSTLIMDSDLPTLSLPLSLCQLLDLMGSFSSFHFKWISPLLILLFFLGIIDLIVYPSGVYVCVCTWIHATFLLFWIMYFYWYIIYIYYIICSKMHKF